MDLIEILKDKSQKKKKPKIINGIMEDILSLNEIDNVCEFVNDKKVTVILEAIEETTNKKLKQLDSSYLELV